MKIEPKEIFLDWTPFDVSEDLDNISDSLDDVLWDKGLRNQGSTVSDIWDQFTEEQQKELNDLEKTNQSKFHWHGIFARYDAVEKSQCK